MPTCKKCGAEIKFIKTRHGGSMPVDVEQVGYTVARSGKDTVITPAGDVLSRVKIGEKPYLDMAYIPHSATCKDPDAFRKPTIYNNQLSLDI